MATKPQIAVAITATNELSGVLATIRKDMEAAGREARDLGADLGKALSSRGLSPGQLRGSVGGAIGRAGMIPGLGAIAGAGSIAGIGEIVTRYSQMGVTLGNTARLAGVSAQEMNGLRGAARMVGLSADTADQAMTGLNETISAATFGHNNEAAVAFKRMGIDLSVVNGHAKRSSEVLPQIVEQIARIAKVDPRPARDLMAAIGMTPEALPLFAMGAQRLGHLTDSVQQLDRVTGASQESSARFTEAMGRMGVAGDGLARTIATAVEPHLTPLLNGLATWVSKHGPDIGGTFDHLGQAIEGVHWAEIGTQVERVGSDVAAVVKHLEDFGTRMDRVTTNVGNFIHLVQTPGRVFYDALQRGGDIPQVDDLGRPIEGTGGFAVTTERMRNGQSPGPDEGMSIPPPQQRPARVTQTFDTTLSPAARGLLDTIAGTESPGYNTVYGGATVNDLSEHPNIPIQINSGPHKGETSTASGRYQFLKKTWDTAAAALGLTDFSPASQDKAAWWLAQHDYNARTGRDLSTDLKSNDPAVKSRIGGALHDTWTSLPGGIEAGTTDRRFNAQLDSNTAREEKASQRVITSDPKDETRDFAAGAKPQQSTVQIEITHNNAPDGVMMSAKASGLAEMGDIRTTRTMPARSRRDDG